LVGTGRPGGLTVPTGHSLHVGVAERNTVALKRCEMTGSPGPPGSVKEMVKDRGRRFAVGGWWEQGKEKPPGEVSLQGA